MKILVTGANGFVGINIVRQLLLAGDTVICTYRSRFDDEGRDFLKGFEERLFYEKLDVCDREEIDRLIKTYGVERIIHAAGLTPGADEEGENPERVMDINLMGTVHVVKAAVDNGLDRVIYVGSDGMYGPVESMNELVTEDKPASMTGLYAICKFASESFCTRMTQLTGIQTHTGRVCATYGPMERPTTSRQNMSTIQVLARAVLEGREIRVRRRGMELGKNWTHVDDIAGGFVALVKADKLSYPAYNLSYGHVYTLAEVLETFKKVEPSFKYTIVEDDEEWDLAYNVNQQRGILDTSRLRNDAGYTPKFDLESGIREYLTWLRSK